MEPKKIAGIQPVCSAVLCVLHAVMAVGVWCLWFRPVHFPVVCTRTAESAACRRVVVTITAVVVKYSLHGTAGAV